MFTRHLNADGTRNVYCPQCKNFISVVSFDNVIATALCTVCQLMNEGVCLTEQQIAELRTGVRDTYIYSQASENRFLEESSVYVEPPKMKALVFSFKTLVAAVKAIVQKRIKTSTKVAQAKRGYIKTIGATEPIKTKGSVFDLPLDK